MNHWGTTHISGFLLWLTTLSALLELFIQNTDKSVCIPTEPYITHIFTPLLS